jgi:hypothetical protein
MVAFGFCMKGTTMFKTIATAAAVAASLALAVPASAHGGGPVRHQYVTTGNPLAIFLGDLFGHHKTVKHVHHVKVAPKK